MLRVAVVKFFVLGLIFCSLSVLNALAEEPQQATTPEAISLQNFEPDNGTEDDYFVEIWKAKLDFATDIVYSGTRSLMVETGDQGGTVAISFSSEDGCVDLSKANKIGIWVYDTTGANTVQIRLKDVDGNGGSGNDENFLWSTTSTRKNAWKEIKWSLKKYPKVEDLNLEKISTVEIYLPVGGTYYLDDLELLE